MKVIRSTKAGYNADDPDVANKNLNFDSRFKYLQYKNDLLGNLSYTSDTTKTVTHDLGYLPAFLSYIKENGDSYWHNLYRVYLTHSAVIDDTELNIYAKNGDEVSYVIFVRPVEDAPAQNDFVVEDDYGILVLPTDKTLETVKEDEVLFYSQWGCAIIVKELSIAVSVTGSGNYSSSEAHGLNYTPAFTGFINNGSFRFADPFVFIDMGGATLAEIRVDDTNVTARVETTDSGSYTYYFRINLLNIALET